MPEFLPPPAGDMQPVPVDPTERCLNAVDGYLRHDGLGVAFGDVPQPVRAEWRAVAETKPVMDATTEYHWGWMCAELGVSSLIYQEPDNTTEAAVAAFRGSMNAFNRIAQGATANRFERGKADIAAGAVPLYFEAIKGSESLRSTVTSFCEKLGVSLKDMLAWYNKTGDPALRGYINSLSAMGILNIGYMTEAQTELVVTPAPSRYQEGLGDKYAEPSNSDLWVWHLERGNRPARVGQLAPQPFIKFDPLLLDNGGYKHSAGHTLGAAQAVAEVYGGSRLALDPARRRTRNTFFEARIQELLRAGRASSQNLEYVHLGAVPNPEQATPQEWYAAHPPGMEIGDRKLLRQQINSMNSNLRRLPSSEVEMLGWMCVEARGDAGRYAVGRQMLERVIGPYQAEGNLPKSFEVAIAAIATPLYGAINRGAPEAEVSALRADYRSQLADLTASMLDWRGQESLDPAQAPALDRLLDEATVKLLFLSDNSFLPLPASPRNKGEYMPDEDRERHWDVSVFVANLQGAFSPNYAARFRMADGAVSDATLDECVYAVAPNILQSKPGQHPLLSLLLREAQGEPVSDAGVAILNRARKTLSQATRVANLV